MRLTASIATAAALHGIVFGVAAAVLSRQPVHRPVPPAIPIDVDVEVIAPRPDPTSEAPPAEPAPAIRPSRVGARRHEVARPTATVETAPEAASEPAPPAAEPLLPTALPEHAAPRAAEISVPAPRTEKSSVVSAVPRYRSNTPPDYPIPSRRRGEEGVVLLNVTVSASGLPTAISLNRSSGHPLLDRAALDAVRRWTFEPGRAGGSPISSQVVVPVRFSLSEQP